MEALNAATEDDDEEDKEEEKEDEEEEEEGSDADAEEVAVDEDGAWICCPEPNLKTRTSLNIHFVPCTFISSRAEIVHSSEWQNLLCFV